MPINIKRAYVEASPDDGWRVLVDRIWPRGRSKEELKLDVWHKDLSPSPELRKWFGHDPAKWEEFLRRYHAELEAKRAAVDAFILELKAHKKVTLVYGAKDEQRNQAVALMKYLEKKF